MTDKTDKKNKIPVSVGKEEGRALDGAVNTRRALLKGAVGTMPMILTLQSGAALARSSNMISASSSTNALDDDGRMLCLDYRFVQGTYGDTNQLADAGEPPYLHVTAIRDGQYSVAKNASSAISREEMCDLGGPFFNKLSAGGFEECYVPRGMLVSATALSSFAGSIDITEI